MGSPFRGRSSNTVRLDSFTDRFVIRNRDVCDLSSKNALVADEIPQSRELTAKTGSCKLHYSMNEATRKMATTMPVRTGNRRLMREVNSKLVLGLIRGSKTTSQVELLRKTQLTRARWPASSRN